MRAHYDRLKGQNLENRSQQAVRVRRTDSREGWKYGLAGGFFACSIFVSAGVDERQREYNYSSSCQFTSLSQMCRQCHDGEKLTKEGIEALRGETCW